ncbi:nucleoid-associated protein, partial [Paenibacillus odorifer]
NKAIQLDSENNTFKVQTDILPSAKENLHKCAIVKLDANLWTEGIHLRVLDKQQIKGEVSKFFLFTFLEAKKVVNDKSMTELVQNKLLEFALSEKYITVREMGDFSRKVDRILTSNRDVDLDRDLESLFSHYVEGDADTERAIGDFKVKLIDHDEHSYFKFRADNEKTKNLIISDVGKTLRIQFPIQYFGKEIIINDIDESTKGLLIDEISREEQGKVMIIRGLDLDQRVI